MVRAMLVTLRVGSKDPLLRGRGPCVVRISNTGCRISKRTHFFFLHQRSFLVSKRAKRSKGAPLSEIRKRNPLFTSCLWRVALDFAILSKGVIPCVPNTVF